LQRPCAMDHTPPTAVMQSEFRIVQSASPWRGWLPGDIVSSSKGFTTKVLLCYVLIQNKCCMQRRRQRRAKGAVPELMFGKPSSTDDKADMNSNMKAWFMRLGSAFSTPAWHIGSVGEGLLSDAWSC
jgi:hypothetical protein